MKKEFKDMTVAEWNAWYTKEQIKEAFKKSRQGYGNRFPLRTPSVGGCSIRWRFDFNVRQFRNTLTKWRGNSHANYFANELAEANSRPGADPATCTKSWGSRGVNLCKFFHKRG